MYLLYKRRKCPTPPCPARPVTITNTKIASAIYPVPYTQEITATQKAASFFWWSKKVASFKSQKSQSDCLFSLFLSPSLFVSNWKNLGSCTCPIQEFGDDGFMIWMARSIVHLFSIGITFSALWQPISTLHGVGKGWSKAVPKYGIVWDMFPSFYISDLCSFTSLCVQQAKSFHSYERPLYLHSSLPT